MTEQSKIEERRQRAREAYYDSTMKRQAPEGSAVALEDAIETATRVKITDELIEKCDIVHEEALGNSFDQMRAAIAYALAELGFEVES